MKLQATMLVGTASLVWAAAAADDISLPTNVGEPSCSCQAACNIRGDPHVTDFYGVTWLQSVNEGDTLNMYSIPSAGLSVTGDIITNDWVGQLNIKQASGKTESFKASDCDTQSTFSTTVNITGKGSVIIESECAKKDGQWHLDTYITRAESSGLDFQAEEVAIGSTGVCQEGPVSRRRLRSLSSSTDQITCSCSAACSLVGDPHLTSFFGVQETMTGSEFSPSDITGESSTVVLDDKKSGFQIIAYVDTKSSTSTKLWIHYAKFGSDLYSAKDMCTANGQRYSYTHSLTGSTVTMTLECNKNSNSGNMFFFNLYVEKVDTNVSSQTGTATFQSFESGAGNTGICYLQ